MTRRRRLSRELKLPRRTMLRGMAGGSAVALALPLLEAMLNDNGTRLANGAEMPRRLLLWHWGNGIRREHWIPTSEGPNYDLTAELAPLANVKDDITVLTGFKNYVAGRRGHHDGMAGLWSCHPFVQLNSNGAPYASKFGGPSIDQVAADIIGTDTFHRSLQIGVTKRHEANQGPTLATISHRGPDQPLFMERDPVAVYDKLFNAFIPADDPTAGSRAKALDAVLADAARLKQRVSNNDGLRIDAHIESIFQLKKQMLSIPAECEIPDYPDVPAFLSDNTEPMRKLNEAMAQLVVLAFSCDLTRVISYMFTGPSGGTQFYMLPPSEFPGYPGAKDYSFADQHSVSHINLDYEQFFIHRSVVFSMENLAYLLELLKSVESGAGTLLDQCAVLAGSDVSEGWAHSEDEFPMIVAGGAGGRLKTGVGHYRSPNMEPIHNVSLACVKAVLPNPEAVSKIGSASGAYDGVTTTPSASIYAG